MCYNKTGIQALPSLPKKIDGERREAQAFNSSNVVNNQTPLMSIEHRDKLLFSVFTLLQKLAADERPEVCLTFVYFTEVLLLLWSEFLMLHMKCFLLTERHLYFVHILAGQAIADESFYL